MRFVLVLAFGLVAGHLRNVEAFGPATLECTACETALGVIEGTGCVSACTALSLGIGFPACTVICAALATGASPEAECTYAGFCENTMHTGQICGFFLPPSGDFQQHGVIFCLGGSRGGAAACGC